MTATGRAPAATQDRLRPAASDRLCQRGRSDQQIASAAAIGNNAGGVKLGPAPACRKFLSPRRREGATFMEITLVVRIADLGIHNDIKPPLEAISGVGS